MTQTGQVDQTNEVKVEQKSPTPEKAAANTKKKANRKDRRDEIITSATGYRMRLLPVAANTLREAQAQIPDAPMRTYTNPNSGKEEENPAHPEYIAEMKIVQEQRVKAAMNAMVLFGVELLDPIPDDNIWLKKCVFMKFITQTEHDEAIVEDGEFLRELYFKNYIACDMTIINKLASMSGVTQEMVAQARGSFPG